MKRRLLFFIFVCMFITVEAQRDTIRIGGILYEKNLRYGRCNYDFGAVIEKNTNIDVMNVLPMVKYKGKEYPVTVIKCDISFDLDDYNYSVREIILPSSIKGVHLHGLSKLEKIVLPDSLLRIDLYVCGIKDIIIPPNVEHVELSRCSQLKSVNIPNSVKTVKFFWCSSLEKLVLPNSVTVISGGLSQCGKLQSVILPDKSAFVEYIDNDFFLGCKSLRKIEGVTIKYPSYIIENAEWNRKYADDVPFFRKGNIDSIKSSFTYFAQERIVNEVEAWQKKKEYETTAQWQTRVTETNRAKKVQEAMEAAKSDYIRKYTGTSGKPYLACQIGAYDADYEIFPITDSSYGTFYANVPLAEAPEFKDKFNKVEISPVLGIKNDHIGIISATFTLDDKVYHSAELFGNTGADKDIAINLPPLKINIDGESTQPTLPNVKIDRSIDMQIPLTDADNTNTFAVIIGNENYTQVAKVPYASNDAKVFAEYCKKTLGLPENNVRIYTDATFGTILEAMNNIASISKAYNGDLNVIFYYAGHGVPNESTGDAYLLPVDASGRQTEACYPLDRLYAELGGMNAHKVVVFIDACFSGAERGDNMLASARGVAIKAKNAQAHGNMVVFTAATGDQTAYPYNEKGHGLFTYFLLKKLQETKGEATLGEICSYVSEQVERQSVVVNGKSQQPTVIPSFTMTESWKGLKLR